MKMSKLLRGIEITRAMTILCSRKFSRTCTSYDKYSCKMLVVGGGTGGCSVAAKFARHLKKNDLIVLEPSEYHYYQPLFTLIGGGVGTLEEARRNEKDVLPKNAHWLKDEAVDYEPQKNIVRTKRGHTIEYDYLLIAVGLDLRYDKIPGLLEALSKPGGVCSNYSPKYIHRTFEALQNLRAGNAIFTFPNGPVKCAGASQKICYISEHYLRKEGKRNDVIITYNTSLPDIFGIKKYGKALWNICKDRVLDVARYAPMATPESLSKNTDITNAEGMVNVNKYTMQHVKFPNIFSIGDCSSCPNSKTAAAAAAQSKVVYKNMESIMAGQDPQLSYDGYSSCPILTGYNKCILAEFNYDLEPLETFPFSQAKERYSMFFLKKKLDAFALLASDVKRLLERTCCVSKNPVFGVEGEKSEYMKFL